MFDWDKTRACNMGAPRVPIAIRAAACAFLVIALQFGAFAMVGCSNIQDKSEERPPAQVGQAGGQEPSLAAGTAEGDAVRLRAPLLLALSEAPVLSEQDKAMEPALDAWPFSEEEVLRESQVAPIKSLGIREVHASGEDEERSDHVVLRVDLNATIDAASFAGSELEDSLDDRGVKKVLYQTSEDGPLLIDAYEREGAAPSTQTLLDEGSHQVSVAGSRALEYAPLGIVMSFDFCIPYDQTGSDAALREALATLPTGFLTVQVVCFDGKTVAQTYSLLPSQDGSVLLAMMP